MADPPPHNEDEISWKRNALCFQLSDMGLCPADLWFQEDFTLQSKEAADICFQCPVRQECLKLSCDNKEPFGVWGGLPISIRKKKGRPYNYSRLKSSPNPYDTEDESSPYHSNNLEGDLDE